MYLSASVGVHSFRRFLRKFLENCQLERNMTHSFTKGSFIYQTVSEQVTHAHWRLLNGISYLYEHAQIQ